MAGKMKEGAAFDISSLFEQELQAGNEELRQKAAQAMLKKPYTM